MKTGTLFTILILTFTCFVQGQDCKVKSKAIAGQYTGDCKKGWAEGQGKSVGKDTYEGEFKKGLPHGNGIYTYANGDVFDGAFNKGKMHGEGKLTTSDGKEKTGFWEHNDYIGQFAKKYQVIRQNSKITRVEFRYKDGDSNQIDMMMSQYGKIVDSKNISLVKIEGSFSNISQTSRLKSILAVDYPFRFIVSGAHDFEAVINTPGHWEVIVNY